MIEAMLNPLLLPTFRRHLSTQTNATSAALDDQLFPILQMTHHTLPLDTVINLAFGLLMALFGLITIYQTARLAALQSHSELYCRCHIELDSKLLT